MKKFLMFISFFVIAAVAMAQTLPEAHQGGNTIRDTRSGSTVIYKDAPAGYISSLAVTPPVRIGSSDPGSRGPAVVLTKTPDLGPYWAPISTSSSYVYSNSFIAPGDGAPSDLGMWLMGLNHPLPTIRFEIWGDKGGNLGPDPTNILATTGSLSPAATGALAFFSAPVLPGASNLTNGSKYWFCATVVGEPAASGYYVAGGHTQNSVYNDNGTFWVSNDPTGIVFNYFGTPEIAFQVTIDAPIPPQVPLSNWALYLGIFLIVIFTVIRFRRVI